MKNYWVYFVSSLVSLVGSNFFIFTQGWYLLEITGEKTSVGLTWSLFFLPSLVFLPLVGMLLDHFDLKRVLISFEVLKVLILATFVPLLHWYPTRELVYILAVLYGIAFVPYYPSVYVMVKRLVPESLQTRYSHLFELSLQGANIVACFACGFLYEWIGFVNLLLISVTCVLVGWIGMNELKLVSNKEKHSILFAFRGYRRMLDLFLYLRRDSTLSPKQFGFGILHQFPQAIVLVANVPIILYVNEIMKKGPTEYGILDAIIGVAALSVSLLWSRYHELSHAKRVNVGVTLLAGLAVAVTGYVAADGIWPYLWMGVYGTLLISSKILARGAVVRMVSKQQMGLYSTLFQTFGYTIMLALFFAISAISELVSVGGLFVVLGGLLVVYSFAVLKLYQPTSSPVVARQ